MAKKVFEVEYDDDLHMADAADDPGYKRAMLFDDQGALKGQAKMREISEDELFDQNEDQDSSSPESDNLLAGAIGIAIGAAAVFLAPRALHWVKSKLSSDTEPSPDEEEPVEYEVSCLENSERIAREESDNTRTSIPAYRLTASESAMQLARISQHVDPKTIQADINTAYKSYRENISSEEAQKTLVEIVVLATLLSERIKRLSNANIIDDEINGGYLGWRKAVKQLTSRKLIGGVNQILKDDIRLLNADEIVYFEGVLGRRLYKNGRFVPIKAKELRRQLMPRS